MPRPLTIRLPRQTPKTSAINGFSTRARLLVAALIPALMVSTADAQPVGALETAHSVIYNNHFVTDDSGAKHDFGIHNLRVSTSSGGRFAAGTVGSVDWKLWANGTTPPIMRPTLRNGQRVITTLILPAGFKVLTAEDLSGHPDWNVGGTTPCWSTRCTVDINSDGSLTVRLSELYTGADGDMAAERLFWSTAGNIHLPVRAVRGEPTSTSVRVQVKFPNPEQSSAPDHADAAISWATNAAHSRSFGLYGDGTTDTYGNRSPYLLANHPGAGNYWPRQGKGKIAFDLQPASNLRPVSVRPGDQVTFTIGGLKTATSASLTAGVYYEPVLEAGYPVTDACTTAPAGWTVVSCKAGWPVPDRVITWERVGPATSDAFAQPYRVELPVQRGEKDSNEVVNGDTSAPSVGMTVALADEAVSNSVQLRGQVQAEAGTETTLGVYDARITSDAGTPGLSPGQTGLFSIKPQIDNGIGMTLAKNQSLSYTFRLPAGLAPGIMPKPEDTTDWYSSWKASGGDTVTFFLSAKRDLPNVLGDREKLSAPVIATDDLTPGQTADVSLNLKYPNVSSSPHASVTVPVQTAPVSPPPSATPEPTPSVTVPPTAPSPQPTPSPEPDPSPSTQPAPTPEPEPGTGTGGEPEPEPEPEREPKPDESAGQLDDPQVGMRPDNE